uniref:NR LBD domain-containing protein n=1 Tax=Globodera pallida TaxID=36090 RepID=A0A183BZ96_GLOPA
MFDFVERAIQLSLEVDSLLGIGLRRHPLEAFRQQNGKIEVYLSMNRLFYWIIEAQNYINGGWIYGGIIPDIEHKIREKSRIMAIFYGHGHSYSPSSSASSSASAFSDKNLRKNNADDEKNVQNWEHNKIGFDAQERQVMREILAIFKTLLHPLRIHDVQAEHHKLVQHLVMLVVFYKHIFELVIVPQMWLLDRLNFNNELKQLKGAYNATLKTLHNIADSNLNGIDDNK